MGWLSALGGIAGNFIAPGVGGALGGMLGGALEGGGSGGRGGGSAYVPMNQAGIDQRFQDSSKQYQDSLNQMNSTANPYNQQLFQGQMNNPYSNVLQAGADQASQAISNQTQQLQNVAGQNWRDYQDQIGGADRRNQQFQANIGYAGDATRGLLQQADKSNQTYQGLLDYQKGQLGNITGAQGNLYAGGNQVLQTALDPQQALFNRTQQQLTEQNRAGQYARGIQQSPYGAALEQEANKNLAIDWQNQQLARQTQGLQSAQGAYGSAQGMGNSYTGNMSNLQTGMNQNYGNLQSEAQSLYLNALNAETGNAMQNMQGKALAQQMAQSTDQQVAQNLTNIGQVPYNAYQQQYGNQAQALNNYQNAYSPYLSGLNSQQGQYLNYLGYGQGAQTNAFNQNMKNQQMNQQAISSVAGPVMDWAGSKGNDWFQNSDVGNWAFNALGGMGGSM